MVECIFCEEQVSEDADLDDDDLDEFCSFAGNVN